MAISLAESLSLGLADILSRKVRSIVTIIGIILGVMSIMVVLAIVNGMNKTTLDWMGQRGGLNKVEVRQNWDWDLSRGGEPTFSLREIQQIRELLPPVEAFNPQTQLQPQEMLYGELGYVVSMLGVFPDMEKVEDWQVAKGRFINLLDIDNHNNVVVLGSTTAKELFSSRDPLGQYVGFAGQKLLVVGVMEEKYMKAQGGGSAFTDNALEYMNQRAFVPLSTLLSKIDPNQKVNSLSLQAASPEAAKELRKKVEDVVLNIKQGKKVFEVSAAQEQMDQMKQSSMIFSAIFVLIAVISLLVGGIVIMNITLASVKERTREIGVRIAVGARRRDIFAQFMVQTILITALGGVLGIILGFSILKAVGSYLDLQVIASVQMIWVALLVSVGVGLIFGISPAMRASKLDPVEALRED
ncbi:MAG TPA: ABC transporter permease [Candidatus Syntrophosphaera sp.]|jgi:putative ABC transport system permease protein|nr:ABC transporter permease [Candidatus Syntrophosphaera sp.]